MTTTAETDMLPSQEDALLRQCLQQAAPDVFGTGITEIGRAPFELATSYDIHMLTVSLADGGERKVILKDFGASARPKNDWAERRVRERRVYETLLAGAGPGAARYYGSVWDENRGRYWLLLEYVDGDPTAYCDLSQWGPAAAALGRLHAHFAPQADRLLEYDFLLRHDEAFYKATAGQALRDVEQLAPHLLGRLDRLLRRYDQLVPQMLDQPKTLIQGGCRAFNVLINVRPDPARVVILDWEEAAVGAGLMDVAYLLNGVKPPLLDQYLDAYRREAVAGGMTLPGVSRLAQLMHAFRLHMIVSSLGHAVAKQYQEKGVTKLIHHGEKIEALLAGHNASPE